MIHYILIPTEERKALRREYRLRLVIITLFFVSCALVLGIVTLMPAFLLSRQQENEVQVREEILRKTRVESGAEEIEKELVLSQAIAQKINNEKDPVFYGEIIQKIISHRKKDLSLTLFDVTQEIASSTSAKISVQGIAINREALIQFKKELEEDAAFTEVTLPLSDLAKSKNIFFTITFKAVTQ